MRTRHNPKDSKESRHDLDPTCTNRPRRPLPQSAPRGWQPTSFRDCSVYLDTSCTEKERTLSRQHCSISNTPIENLAAGTNWSHQYSNAQERKEHYTHETPRSENPSVNWATDSDPKKINRPLASNRRESSSRNRSHRALRRCSTEKYHHEYRTFRNDIRPPARIPATGDDRLRCRGGSINTPRCSSHCYDHAGITESQTPRSGFLSNSTDHDTHLIHKGLRS
jgi:transglutaminase/protease-like cytokinesis protein 3